MPEILFARQAILDANLDTIAYELLFRGGHETRAEITNPDHASSNVLLNAFANQNIDEVVGGRWTTSNCAPTPKPRSNAPISSRWTFALTARTN